MKTIMKDCIGVIKCSLANIMTFLNLTLGCLSLIFMTKEEYYFAAILIILGTFLDRFDGKIARKFDATSEFGKELDSLADLVTFGLAPAFLIWSLKLSHIAWIGTAIAIIFILAGAFRLARFNSSENNGIFIGVPITIAGGLMAVLALLIMRYHVHLYGTIITTLLLSYLMVTTRIKITKR